MAITGAFPGLERALFNVWAKEHRIGFAAWLRKSDLQILAALRSKPGLVEILGGDRSTSAASIRLKKFLYETSSSRPFGTRQFHTAPPLSIAITDLLWNNHFMEFIKLLESPFVTGISAGTLSDDVWQYFLHQETIYLASLRKTTYVALRCFTAEIPSEEETALRAFFERFKIGVGREIQLVNSQKKADLEWPVSSVCYHYSHWQRALAEKKDLTVLLFGLISCLKIYYAIARVLWMVHGDTEEFSKHRYARWVKTYGSSQFSHSIYLAESVAAAIYASIQRGSAIPFPPLKKDRSTPYEPNAPQTFALLANAFRRGFDFDRRFLDDVSNYARRTCSAEELERVCVAETERISKWAQEEDKKILRGIYNTPWGTRAQQAQDPLK